MKMKSSASPFPLDQISVVAFNKCPILRSHLTNILQTAWTAKTFPDVWKSGVTVLAYKKGDAGNPWNFRSITLPSLEIDFSTSLRKTNTLKRILRKFFLGKYQAVSNTSNVYRIS